MLVSHYKRCMPYAVLLSGGRDLADLIHSLVVNYGDVEHCYLVYVHPDWLQSEEMRGIQLLTFL